MVEGVQVVTAPTMGRKKVIVRIRRARLWEEGALEGCMALLEQRLTGVLGVSRQSSSI